MKSHCLAVFFSLISAPLSASQWIGPGADAGIATRGIEAILSAQPLGAKENIRVTPIARSEESAHVLVQVRDREPLHYHADSDITVLMLRGNGEMHIAETRHKVKAGDVLLVPRALVHYFVNSGPEPAVALVIYSPPPGPNDRTLVPPAR